MTKKSTNTLTEHFFRHNYAKMVAVLTNYFGLSEIEITEDIVQDTLIEAMERWSIQSIPDNPEGWMMDVAKKKMINYLNRHHNFKTKIALNLKTQNSFKIDSSLETDSTLKMIFTCCHPLLPIESQISLALKSLCGLNIKEIANAFLTTESTINKRLYRAKQKFRDHSINFKLPDDNELIERLDTVFSTLYLLFNEGYYSTSGKSIIRMDLCFESIRIVKEIIEHFPKSSNAKALLALMTLSIARFESRTDEKGAIVILSDQNRLLWDKTLIAQGLNYLCEASVGDKVSIYHLQAGIAAEHCLAEDFKSTNWKSIYEQYTFLENISDPNPIIALNKAISKFYGINKQEALDDLLSLKEHLELKKHTHYFTSLGIFYSELNQQKQAIPCFEKALELSDSPAEQQLIKTFLKK